MPPSKDQKSPDDKTFERWMFGVIAVLVAAGVAGLWGMNGSLSRLDERVALWTRIFEGRFESTARDIREHDRRLDNLERDPRLLPRPRSTEAP